MTARTVERYERRTILFHWVHAALFLILLITGFVMFLPLGIHGGGFALSIVHRAAAVAFVASPVLHAIFKPAKAKAFMRETLVWGRDDIKWFIAAFDYYFGGRAERMPPQGHINTGQKLWQIVSIGTGIAFLITGIVLLFFRPVISVAAYQWVLLAHGIAFVIVLAMFLVHIYMGVFHPRSAESLRSILYGRVSESYAKSHYRKWYDSINEKPQD